MTMRVLHRASLLTKSKVLIKFIIHSQILNFCTNRTNAWDDWEPNAMDYSNLEYSATPEQATLPNLSLNNAVVEPYVNL